MRGGTTFAAVLEETLEAFPPEPGAEGPSPRLGHAPPHPFLFGPQCAHLTPRPSGAAIEARPRRRLTVGQQHALDALVRLGAKLGPNFTAGELRSAFRTLARRYHPDRHPVASQFERVRLSRQFTDLTSNHQQLLTALEPACM